MASFDPPAAERERVRNEANASARVRPVPPRRHRDESDAVYGNRCWRWEMWLRQEPRPDCWFATSDEVVLYQAWRDAMT